MVSGLERRFWKGRRLPTLWASEDCLPDKVVLEREALPTPYPATVEGGNLALFLLATQQDFHSV